MKIGFLILFISMSLVSCVRSNSIEESIISSPASTPTPTPVVDADTTAPLLTGLADDLVATKSKTWTWGCEDAHSPCTYRFVVDQNPIFIFTVEPFNTTTTVSQSSGSGTFYLHIQAKDSLNNTSSAVYYSAVLDNQGPSLTASSPTPTIGKSTTTFSYPLTYTGSSSVNLTADKVTLVTSGDVSCSTKNISNGTTVTPTVEISGCTGAGTMKITIAGGSSQDSLGNLDTGLADSTTVQILQAPSNLSYYGLKSYWLQTVDVGSNMPLVSGQVDSFSISPALPAGMSFNTTTGEITGTPTNPMAPTLFTLTATNATGNTTYQFTMEVRKKFVVNTTDDTVDASAGDGICADAGGNCSLRAAMAEVNALTTYGGYISMPAGTFTLTTGNSIDFTKKVTLIGVDSASTIIEQKAAATQRVISTIDDACEIQKVWIRNGSITAGMFSSGAGIYAMGSLLVKAVKITNNQLTCGSCNGGGIGSTDFLTVEDSHIEANSAPTFGTGIFAQGPITIRNTYMTANVGGGSGSLRTSHKEVYIENCYFKNDMVVSMYFPILVKNSTFENSQLLGNSFHTSPAPDMIIQNSTFYNSTVSISDVFGAAINTLSISNSTFGSTIDFKTPTYLSGNIINSCNASNSSYLHSQGHNITLDDSCGFSTQGQVGDRWNTNPLLGAFQNNGGPWPTMLPQTGSPAIDGGASNCSSTTDQRGLPRPVDKLGGGSKCDIGSVEVQ